MDASSIIQPIVSRRCYGSTSDSKPDGVGSTPTRDATFILQKNENWYMIIKCPVGGIGRRTRLRI
jgi:hypothetical protein